MKIDKFGTGRLPPETTLQNGRYIIVKQVGKGGMGAVYEATDTASRPHLRVAIKEMSLSNLKSQAEFDETKELFRQEAETLSKLNHPHLPRVYDWFEEKDRSYLVMEFVDGLTLLQKIEATADRPNVPTRPLATAKVLDYAYQLCDALEYLHRQTPPIIFRDLKPSNVMIKADEHLYLIDFGIARTYKEGQESDTKAFGSYAYASPQQLDGKQTNARSDLYNLGATLHHCLTGKAPSYMSDHVYPSVRSLNISVPPEIDGLVMRLVAIQEDQRPVSATEVKRILLQIKHQLRSPNNPVPVRPIPAPQPFQPPEPEIPLPPKPAQEKILLPGSNGNRPPANIYSLDTDLWKPPDPETPFPVGPGPTPPVQPVAASTSSDLPQMMKKVGKVVLFAGTSLAKVSGPLITNIRSQLSPPNGHQRRQKYKLSPAAQQPGKNYLDEYGDESALPPVPKLPVTPLPQSQSSPREIKDILARLMPALSLFLCAMLGLGIVVALFSLFHALHIAAVVVEFCLAFSLLLVATIASRKTQDPAPQNILIFTGLTMAVVCLASLGEPVMQRFISTLTFGLLNSETTINQLAFAGLIGALLFLFIRFVCARLFVQPFAWTGRICVFVVAMVAALVQAAFWWNDPLDQSALSFVPPDTSPTLLPAMIDGFRLLPLLVAATVAWGLFWAARIVLLRLIDQIPGRDSTIGEIVPKLPLRANVAFGKRSSLKAPIIPESGYASIKKAMIRIDRLVVLAVLLTTMLLQWFFGERIPLFAGKTNIFSYANVIDFHINWLVIVLLGIVLIGCLIVMGRPMKLDKSTSLPRLIWWDYFSVCIPAVICMCFLTWNTGISQHHPLSFKLQDASMLFPERIVNIILAVGLIVTAFVSLLWLSRPYFVKEVGATTRKNNGVHRILGTLFCSTILLTLLAVLLSLVSPGKLSQQMPHTAPTLLASALMLLILGVLMAVWAENHFKEDTQTPEKS